MAAIAPLNQFDPFPVPGGRVIPEDPKGRYSLFDKEGVQWVRIHLDKLSDGELRKSAIEVGETAEYVLKYGAFTLYFNRDRLNQPQAPYPGVGWFDKL